MTALVGLTGNRALRWPRRSAAGETVEQAPERREACESGYDRFRAIYRALRPLEDA
jgi:hypothetical protein